MSHPSLDAPRPRLSPALGWGVAALLFAVALAARFALIGVLPPTGFPFLTFFPAVMLTAYFVGLVPGLVVSVASILAARYFFMEPTYAFTGTSMGDNVALGFFTLVLLVDCVIVHVMATALERVRRTAHALDESRRALEAADRRKDAFLAMLAHELRNPLAPIAAAAHLLEDDTGATPAHASAVATIRRQVRHMARLLDDLLDVSRITLDKLELRRERTDVAAVVQRALDAARPALAARGHEVAIQLASAPVDVEVDRVRIEQVLLNLLNNAAKYTPDGGRVAVTVDADAARVRIAVRDTGVGLTPAQAARIFELFAQVDARAPAGGLGIGLSLARDLARMHGGDVTVHSDGPARGSTFVLELPRAAREASAPAPVDAAPAAVPRAASGTTVLIADDNRDAADTLRMLCDAAGLRARVAYDGAAAWALAQAERPAVVLLDLGMPGLDGYELARRVRASEWGAEARLVAISGWGREEDRARTREAGFDVHLVKPVEPEALLRALA